MAFKLSLGQYLNGSSWVYRLDPRAKLCCSFVFMIASFAVTTPAQLICAGLCGIALLISSQVPVRHVLASIRPAMVLLGVLSLFNLFFVRTGDALLTLGPFAFTSGGIWAALLYTLRFAVALVAGSLIMLTTTPTALSDAFDALLAPLSRIGLPGHEIAMVLSLMLRFIPTLADDLTTISEAQESRGAALSTGRMAQRVQALVALLVALFASALRHANNLSRALDARCYEGNATRTHLHQLHLSRLDGVLVFFVCAYVVALGVLRLMP
jgi:energy-coupling factor transporter transmembrane protein EcfT